MSDKPVNIPSLMHQSVLRIVMIYMAVSFVYIVSSDAILGLFVMDTPTLTRFQSYKGLVFVIVTAAFLYLMIKQHFSTITHQVEKIKDVQGELKLSKELFSKAFNRSPELLSISTLAEGRFVDVNEGFIESTGYKREELIGKTSFELNLWKNKDDRKTLMRILKEKGKVKDFETVLLNKKGEEKTFLLSAEIITVKKEIHLLIMCRDISETKRIEEALQESEANHRNLIENMHDGVFVLEDSKIIFVNPAFEFMTGYTKEELVNKNIIDLIHPQESFLISSLMKKDSAAIDQIEDGIYNFVKKDGELISVNLSIKEILYNKKRAVLGNILNITDKVLAEKASRENELRLRNFADLLPQTVFEVDINGKITFVNSASYKSFKYTKEDAEKGLNVLDMIVPEDRNRALRDMFKTFKGDEIDSNEYTALRKDGSAFPVMVFTTPIINDNITVGLRGILVDVSDLKEQEHELRKLTNAIEQSPVSIIITDVSGNIEYVNPKFVELTGYSFNEVKGKKPSILNSGAQPEEFYKNLWNTICSGREWKGEFNNKKKDGTIFWESASISPVKNDKGEITHYIAVKEDITQQKKINEELVIAKNKAEESERVKSEFLAQISHEIRTPLNTILGFSSLLTNESSRTDEEQKMISKSLSQAGKRLLRTIDLILNMSMVRAGKLSLQPVKINAREVVSYEIEKYSGPAAEKKLYLDADFSAADPYVICDIYILQEILSNLLDNAIKFTQKGKVSVSMYDDQSDLFIKVKDTGVGISEEYIDHIFEPFSQEHTGYSRTFEGNGLGLSLVKKYLDLINGDISVESKKGSGSIFTIRLSKN
jgi:PAS domain S-box-containing protein